MAALASQADIELRLGRELTEAERQRVEALLEDSSAQVRSYTRQSFDLVTDDEVVTRPVGDRIVLPQRPVTAVTRVVALAGIEGAPDITLTDWGWDGIDTVKVGVGDYVINLPEVWWDEDGYPGTYRVTYSHGYATVPGDVVAVVCGIVGRGFANPNGYRSETVGAYSVTYAVPSTGEALGSGLTRYDRQILDRYRRTTGTIQVGR